MSVSPQELLRVYDAGQGRRPYEQAHYLLRLACPEAGETALAGLTIGEREERLLALRERLFGPLIEALADCPRCGAGLEFQLNAAVLREGLVLDTGEQVLEFPEAALHMRYRPLRTGDLEVLTTADDLGEARRRLLGQALIETRSGDRLLEVAELPEAALQALTERLSRSDPLAEFLLHLTCAECDASFDQIFDVGQFLWREVGQYARTLLLEVHELASVYGWSEAEILSLAPWRRRSYLELVRA